MARALLALALTGCLEPAPFRCEASRQCMKGNIEGWCEASGDCSFPDPGCPSGRRYADLASAYRAGQCVSAQVVRNVDASPEDGKVPDAMVVDAREPDGEAPDAGESDGTVDALSADAPSADGARIDSPKVDAAPEKDAACGSLGATCCGEPGCAEPLSCVENSCTCVTLVAAGGENSCTVRVDRTLHCAGDNRQGQLGDALLSGSGTPARISLPGVLDVTAGGMTICARTVDMTAWCWGRTASGGPAGDVDAGDVDAGDVDAGDVDAGDVDA
ncbi:MAG: hypothetical protein HY698_11935, partial [Deltaproteobacteria bacterium]|nr:hypothetical protein [Deltaproteobacteria bacterium]